MKRRIFLAATPLLGAAAQTQTPTAEPTLLHHVFFWLKNPANATDRAQLIKGLKTLAGIPSIKKMHIGVLASTEKRDVVDTSWDVSELMYFTDEAGQKIYQDHHIHLEFVKNYSHLWQKVIVYDSVDV